MPYKNLNFFWQYNCFFFSVIFATETLVHPKAIRVGGFNRDRVTLRVLLWRVRKTAAQTHLAHEFAANNDASNTW